MQGFFLKDYIEERAVEVAVFIIENNATVRQAAKKFGISKSTVHKDCTDRLQQINPALAKEVRNTAKKVTREFAVGKQGSLVVRRHLVLLVQHIRTRNCND